MWGCWGLLPLLAINWGLVLVGHTCLWRGNSSHFLCYRKSGSNHRRYRADGPDREAHFALVTIKTWSRCCHCANLAHQKIQGDVRISRKCSQPVTQCCFKLKGGEDKSEIRFLFFFFSLCVAVTQHRHFTRSHVSVSTVYISKFAQSCKLEYTSCWRVAHHDAAYCCSEMLRTDLGKSDDGVNHCTAAEERDKVSLTAAAALLYVGAHWPLQGLMVTRQIFV